MAPHVLGGGYSYHFLELTKSIHFGGCSFLRDERPFLLRRFSPCLICGKMN